jgi:hypothetical protein
MPKMFESEALKGASNEAAREQADFLTAVIELRQADARNANGDEPKPDSAADKQARPAH